MQRTLALIAGACALALAGCTDHSKDEKQIRALVTQFAGASGPRACDLMTTVALGQVYGNGHPENGRKNCLAQSKRFRGAAVHITNIHFSDNDTAKAFTMDATGRINYTVTAVRFGKRWKIDGITRG